jgi:hypothetical protein
MSYKEKYLKYKNKYLNLKSKLGGANSNMITVRMKTMTGRNQLITLPSSSNIFELLAMFGYWDINCRLIVRRIGGGGRQLSFRYNESLLTHGIEDGDEINIVFRSSTPAEVISARQTAILDNRFPNRFLEERSVQGQGGVVIGDNNQNQNIIPDIIPDMNNYRRQ